MPERSPIQLSLYRARREQPETEAEMAVICPNAAHGLGTSLFNPNRCRTIIDLSHRIWPSQDHACFHRFRIVAQMELKFADRAIDQLSLDCRLLLGIGVRQ